MLRSGAAIVIQQMKGRKNEKNVFEKKNICCSLADFFAQFCAASQDKRGEKGITCGFNNYLWLL